jgi:hypothetical protein
MSGGSFGVVVEGFPTSACLRCASTCMRVRTPGNAFEASNPPHACSPPTPAPRRSSNAQAQQLAALRSAADGAARAQAEASAARSEALASLQVARGELDTVQGQVAVAREAADRKGQEIRWVG